MDFDYTEEQSLLRDSLARLLRERYPFEARRKAAREPDGWSRALWASLAEQGFLAVGLPEEHGGYGGAVESMIAGEALGAALSPEPYLPTIVLGAHALAQSKHASTLLPGIISGKILVACALEGFAAQRAGQGWALSGKAVVPHAHSADWIVIATDDLVFVVEARSLERRRLRTFDCVFGAELCVEGAASDADKIIAAGAEAHALRAVLQDRAIGYLAAEAVGVMSMVLDATVEHLKTRQQFGQPLASFQTLRHRAVDMLVALEQTRSVAILAAAAHDEPDAREREKAFAAVKAVTSNAARFVGQQAVQLHGGIGLTEEHRAGWGLRRLTMIDLALGDADAQAARLAALGGFVAPV